MARKSAQLDNKLLRNCLVVSYVKKMDPRRHLNGPDCVHSILLRRQSIFSRTDLLKSYLVVLITSSPKLNLRDVTPTTSTKTFFLQREARKRIRTFQRNLKVEIQVIPMRLLGRQSVDVDNSGSSALILIILSKVINMNGTTIIVLVALLQLSTVLEASCKVDYNTDYFGCDIGYSRTTSWKECAEACLRHNGCNFWVYASYIPKCHYNKRYFYGPTWLSGKH